MKPPVRRSILLSLAAAAAAIAFAAGCDDPSNDIPQAVKDQQAKAAEQQKNAPKLPTTQELVSGPRTVTPLGPLPMTMRVPVSWKVEVAGPASHLRGIAPSGEEVTIQLNSRAPIKRAEFESLIKSAKKEQAEKSQSIIKSDLRPFGNAQLFETQKVGEPREWPVFEPDGSKIKTRTTTQQSFDWRIIIFSPQGEAFQRYELSFIGLTKSQYDKDKEFLQGLLDTLSTADGSSATTAPAPAGASPSPATLP